MPTISPEQRADDLYRWSPTGATSGGSVTTGSPPRCSSEHSRIRRRRRLIRWSRRWRRWALRTRATRRSARWRGGFAASGWRRIVMHF
jgi:hypothetical protein